MINKNIIKQLNISKKDKVNLRNIFLKLLNIFCTEKKDNILNINL